VNRGRPGFLLLAVMMACTVRAGTGESAPFSPAQGGGTNEKEPSLYERIWKRAELYRNEDNPVIQSLVLSGRFQLDYALVDGDERYHREWNIRRFRIGAKARLFEKFTLHGEVELNPQEADPLYVRVTDLYLEWSPGDPFRATVGKHSAPFTADGATSSKELLAVDRSNLANNIWFPQEYFPGVSVSGEPGPWVYHAGVYSSGSADREFGKFDGTLFSLVVVGYDFAKGPEIEEALLAGTYLYQSPDQNNTFTRQLGHVGSLNFRLHAGRWGMRWDLAAADGYLGQSDLWGAMAMPFVDVTDKLQLVGRYTFLKSDDVNGLRLATYENRVVSDRGDEYKELYIGLNYYFYKHRLKVQAGALHAKMEDRALDGGAYSGVSGTAGMRVSW
jgi:phosphate-selective porin OprO/OprP